MATAIDVDMIPGLPYDVGLECLVRIPHQNFSSVASVCKTWKRQIQLPEFWRLRRASGFTRRVLVMAQTVFDPTREVGGKKNAAAAAPVYRLTLCEPETGYWAELPTIPDYEGGLPLFCQVVGIGSDLVVLGGCDPVTWEVRNGVYVYDFLSATWRRGADMPGCKRLFFACAADGNRKVFVAGGHDGEKCALKSAMAYDVTEDKWTVLPDMARERDEAKGVFRRGRFVAVGGYQTDAQGRFESSAEEFDPASGEWSPVEDDFLDIPACPRNCVEDGEGNLFICRGGELLVREGSAWKAVAELPAAVRNTAYAAAWEGKVMVIGSEGIGAPYNGFVLDLKNGGKKWEMVGAKEEFSGHVLTGCTLEL